MEFSSLEVSAFSIDEGYTEMPAVTGRPDTKQQPLSSSEDCSQPILDDDATSWSFLPSQDPHQFELPSGIVASATTDMMATVPANLSTSDPSPSHTIVLAISSTTDLVPCSADEHFSTSFDRHPPPSTSTALPTSSHPTPPSVSSALHFARQTAELARESYKLSRTSFPRLSKRSSKESDPQRRKERRVISNRASAGASRAFQMAYVRALEDAVREFEDENGELRRTVEEISRREGVRKMM